MQTCTRIRTLTNTHARTQTHTQVLCVPAVLALLFTASSVLAQCGNLEYDGINGLASMRRETDIESWVMVPCNGITDTEVTWLAIDNTAEDFAGSGD